MFNYKINKDNLAIASNELWAILEPEIQYLPKQDQKWVELAFTQMVMAHGEQRRKNGDYYIIHPVAATITLARIHLDRNTICACLLHDVPEDTHVDIKVLEKEFGSEIAFLVYGITKLSVIKYGKELLQAQTDEELNEQKILEVKRRYAENLRRMFVAMSKDLRVIFIKLADRLHNLQTLKALPPEKAYRIALESLEIYAPIAERLGIGYFRGEIEDAAFPFVYPDEYKQYISLSDLQIQKRSKLLEKIVNKTKRILRTDCLVNPVIIGRAKRYYSIYKKITQQQKSIEEIYDLIALRIITRSIDECYRVLSVLHRYFVPIDHRLKDYIKYPKDNGYQSIHTTVRDEQYNLIFEFQIRTKEMHDYSEYGVAAHWIYKAGEVSPDIENFIGSQNMKWISELVDLGTRNIDEEEYLKNVRLNLFQDRIFVMTPKGDAIDLPKGSTPLDFAFKIHQDIGLHATTAMVNGNVAKLNQELENGDTVKILTTRNQNPQRQWLDWVKTSNATKHIRTSLRKNGVELPNR